MSSRIEQIIEEIEEYVESCKYQPLSTTKIIVNKELLMRLNVIRRSSAIKTPFWRMPSQRQIILLKTPRSRFRKW